MQNPTRLLSLALLALAACGGSSDPRALVSEANTALGNRDYATAVSKFDAALAGAKDAALIRDAKLGRCEALAYTDASRAQSEFLALAGAETVDYSSYNSVAVALTSESKFEEAIAILSQGMAKYPAEKRFEKLRDKIGDAAKNAGDSGALSALAGLGYVGN